MSNVFGKTDLVRCMETATAADQLLVQRSVAKILDYISQHLVQGHRIEVRGFGSLNVHHYADQPVRNPASGQLLFKNNRKRVLFRPSGALKHRVNPFNPSS